MRTATAPSVITATPFGGYTCFYGDPIIDPQGTGIAWFNNDDTNNVYGINTEGIWNSDRVLPFPVYSDWATVDTTRKQGSYLSARYNGGNFIYRACYNSRPVTYTTTPIASLDSMISNGLGIVYDAQTQTVYVSDSASFSNVYAFNVTGTDCPQSAASSDDVSSASAPASSALGSLLFSLLSHI